MRRLGDHHARSPRSRALHGSGLGRRRCPAVGGEVVAWAGSAGPRL